MRGRDTSDSSTVEAETSPPGPSARIRRLLFALACSFAATAFISAGLLDGTRGPTLGLSLTSIAALAALWSHVYWRGDYSRWGYAAEPLLLLLGSLSTGDPANVIGIFAAPCIFGVLHGSRRTVILQTSGVVLVYVVQVSRVAFGDGQMSGMSIAFTTLLPLTASVAFLLATTLRAWEAREQRAQALARLSDRLLGLPDRQSMIDSLLDTALEVTEGWGTGALLATLSNGRLVVMGTSTAFASSLGREVPWSEVPSDIRTTLESGQAITAPVSSPWMDGLGLLSVDAETEMTVEPMRGARGLVGVVGVALAGPPTDELEPPLRDLATNGGLALDSEDQASRFQALVEGSADLVGIASLDGVLSYVSPATETVLGYPPETLMGRYLRDLVHPDDLRAVESRLATLVAEHGGAAHLELRVRHANGSWRQFSVSMRNLAHVPSVQGLVVNAHDVTDRHELEGRLAHQALHDELTGLPNRALLRSTLENALERAARSATRIAVLHVDLDGFKAVNESLGHEAGDELIVETAHRLRAALRASDTVARLGGDEFAIVLDPGSHDEATAIASRITVALQEPVTLHGSLVALSASVGIALMAGDGDATALLRDADTAMLAAKAGGKRQWALFSEAMHTAASQRLLLTSELRSALQHGELHLHYQPIVDLEHGGITSFEALARWVHPTRGMISPGEFIPIAEETGLILELGHWVLEQACRQLKAWHDLLGPHLSMHVNLSARQLDQPGLVDEVATVLRDAGLPARSLVLELTESMAVGGSDLALARLRGLKHLGVRLALDDFGTGYSSLSYLQRLPVDALKIDKSFVDRIDTHPAMLKAIIGLAKSLDLETIAEGVEHASQASGLAYLGCDQMQGYLFSRPCPAPEALDLIERTRAEGAPAEIRAALSLEPESGAASVTAPTPPRAGKSARTA